MATHGKSNLTNEPGPGNRAGIAGHLLAVLGDPTRRAILERLREGPRPVVELARGMPVSRPAVSQHLKVLKEAGLVRDRQEANRRVYSLDPSGFGPLAAYLSQFWQGALDSYLAAAAGQDETRRM